MAALLSHTVVEIRLQKLTIACEASMHIHRLLLLLPLKSQLLECDLWGFRFGNEGSISFWQHSAKANCAPMSSLPSSQPGRLTNTVPVTVN